jgi:predicted metalloenzyme YecM
MHHVTRDLLLREAADAEAAAASASREAERHLDLAVQFDTKANACRHYAEGLRADAEAKPVEVLTVRFDASEVSKEFDRFIAQVGAALSPRMCGGPIHDPRARR